MSIVARLEGMVVVYLMVEFYVDMRIVLDKKGLPTSTERSALKEMLYCLSQRACG